MEESLELTRLGEEAVRVLDTCVQELAEAGHMEAGSLVVLGCSTSEIVGARIGKGSVPELGKLVAEAFKMACESRGFVPVFQCCEHLNRSLVIEKEAALRLGLTRVNAIPQPKAGGSVPAAAWKLMTQPTLVMHVQADSGIDVGDTLIGMHLRPVAVPIRGSYRRLGDANLVMAYTRLPYVGGSRAVYA